MSPDNGTMNANKRNKKQLHRRERSKRESKIVNSERERSRKRELVTHGEKYEWY